MKNLFIFDMNGQSWLNVSFSLHQSNMQDPKSKRNKYLWFRVAIVIPCDMRGKLYVASLLGFFSTTGRHLLLVIQMHHIVILPLLKVNAKGGKDMITNAQHRGCLNHKQ